MASWTGELLQEAAEHPGNPEDLPGFVLWGEDEVSHALKQILP